MTRKEIEQKLKCNKDFSWAVSQLLSGGTVRRDIWSGKPGHYDMIKFIGEYLRIVKPSLPKEVKFNREDVWMNATIAKVNINGIASVGWMPTMEDFLASDWGVGYPDYQRLTKQL